MTNMAQTTDYRKRAEECVQLGQSVRTPEQRTMLLHIAETWLRLAENASRARWKSRNPSTENSNGSVPSGHSSPAAPRKRPAF